MFKYKEVTGDSRFSLFNSLVKWLVVRLYFSLFPHGYEPVREKEFSVQLYKYHPIQRKITVIC